MLRAGRCFARRWGTEKRNQCAEGTKFGVIRDDSRQNFAGVLRLAHKRARRAAAEPETEDEASDSEPEDGKRKAPPPSPSERSFFDSGEHDAGDGREQGPETSTAPIAKMPRLLD